MPDDDQARELKFHLWGWIFFLIGCVIFIVSSIRDGDVLGLVGSVLFLVGCVVFMIPLIESVSHRGADENKNKLPGGKK